MRTFCRLRTPQVFYQVMNLTAIREPEGVARLHMLDCAALLSFCDFKGKTLIDVGTGASVRQRR